MAELDGKKKKKKCGVSPLLDPLQISTLSRLERSQAGGRQRILRIGTVPEEIKD